MSTRAVNKVVESADEALDGLSDDMTV